MHDGCLVPLGWISPYTRVLTSGDSRPDLREGGGGQVGHSMAIVV